MAEPDESPPPSPPYPPAAYSWYAVGILSLAFMSSFVDRQILGLLVVPIRRDLGITDTGMSLLLGLSFALFYTVLGLPIGYLADRISRRRIIGAAIAIWSLMTMACGAARTYAQLFLARVGVGVGEAGLSPPAYSLIADSFPKERLGTAISVYSIGIYVGAGLANVLGGAVLRLVSGAELWHVPVLGAIRPWQTVFFMVGAPGLLIALLALTIREPVRRGVLAGGAQVPLGEVWAYLAANRSLVIAMGGGMGLFALANYGLAAWAPTFMVRTYGWEAADAGVALGLVTMTLGPAGIVAGGWYGDRLLRNGHLDAKLRVCALAAAGLLLCDVAFPLMPTAGAALAVFVPLSFVAAAPFGVAAAAMQEIMPNQMRAQGSALYILVISAVGVGVGPTAVALLTDRVFRDDAALRYSLVVTSATALLIATGFLAFGFAAYRRSLQHRDAWLAAKGISAG